MNSEYRHKYLKYKNKFLSLKNQLGGDRDRDGNKNVVNQRNEPFFSLYENIYKLLKKKFGDDKALELMYELFTASLSQSYGTNFIKGDPHEFARVVGLHDNIVGLRVNYPEITDNLIIYQIQDDPFPDLKGLVDPQKLDASYMNFKLKYLLGDDWEYKMTKHFWNGDNCIEHYIYKKK